MSHTHTSTSVSRRTLLGAGAGTIGALALAACGSSGTPAASPSGATNASDLPASASPSQASPSQASTSHASASQSSASQPAGTAGSVTALAQAFYASLTDAQKPVVQLEYTLENAKKWSNLPQALVAGGGRGPGRGPGGGSQARVGLSIGELSETSLAAFNALLKAATGSGSGVGYAEIQQHLNADDYLGQNGGGSDYSRAAYYVALLGKPQDTGTWEFQFGGHHLAVANTYINGALVGATPSFRGIEPNGTFEFNGTSNQPMQAKEDALTALLASFTPEQLTTAKLPDVYTDLLLGPGKDWAFPTTSAGIQGSALTAEQKKLAVAAMGSYVNDIADADAAKILAKYEAELDKTYVGYSGTPKLTERNDYLRIDGPSVWIEFSMQRGIVLSGNHPHSVWRDRTTDYGGTKS